MGDFSVLFQEYEHASHLSSDLDRALIPIKKLSLGLPGAPHVTPQRAEASRAALHRVLAAVLEFLGPPGHRSVELHASLVIPAAIRTRLQDPAPEGFAGYTDELRAVADALGQGRVHLSGRELEVLERLAAAVDTERSSVFQQMRGRR
jgi:hypothetical protein